MNAATFIAALSAFLALGVLTAEAKRVPEVGVLVFGTERLNIHGEHSDRVHRLR